MRCASLDAEGRIAVHPVGDPALDLSAAFENHLADNDARTRQGAAVALHLIVGVSPEWVAQGGDPHDAKNPNVQDLMHAARDWADREIGGVFAVRYDLDERGAGVVDVLAAPVREHKTTGKAWISTAKALNEMKEREGTKGPHTYSALQDSWHKAARERLDPSMTRGKPKAETNLEHLRPEEYGQIQDERRAVERERERQREGARKLDQGREDLQADRQALGGEQAALGVERAALSRDEDALSARLDAFKRGTKEVLHALGKP